MDALETKLLTLMPLLVFGLGALLVHWWYVRATRQKPSPAAPAPVDVRAEPPRHCTPWDFKIEALQCDTSDPEALEAFLARWRGRVPARPTAPPPTPSPALGLAAGSGGVCGGSSSAPLSALFSGFGGAVGAVLARKLLGK